MRGWAIDIDGLTDSNTNFLAVLHTGEHSQLTVMSLDPGEDIGLHIHRNIDQLVRVQVGRGRLSLGPKRDRLEESHDLEPGWAGFIPAGAWHNVVNVGDAPLKLQIVHSPAKRWRNDVYATRAEALAADEELAREITFGMAGADGFGT